MNVSLSESVKINDDAVHEISAPYLIDIIRGRDRAIGLSIRPSLYISSYYNENIGKYQNGCRLRPMPIPSCALNEVILKRSLQEFLHIPLLFS